MDESKVIVEYKDVEILRKEHVVLKRVNLRVREGETLYLLGKVGSGKSSLLKTMYAEVPVTSGVARVLDYDLTTLRRKKIPYLRREIGVVFQDFQLLTDRNVYQNLLFVLKATGWKQKEEIETRINEVLSAVGMDNKAWKMPHELSGGEQQRIAIARALLNRPRLILADEPTGNLDPETGEQIVEQLHEIARKGTAIVIATHNLGWIEKFPARTLRCIDKHLVEEATDESGDEEMPAVATLFGSGPSEPDSAMDK